MTYKIIFLPDAETDLAIIDLYLSQFYPTTPAKFFAALEKSTSNLAETPDMYPLYPDSNEFRKLIVQEYIVLYKVLKEKCIVEIHAVFHGKRNIQELIHNIKTDIPTP